MHWLTGDEPERRLPGLGGAWLSELWPFIVVGVIMGLLTSTSLVIALS